MYHDLQKGIRDKIKPGEILQSIDLSTQWDISFIPEMGGPTSLKLDNLVSWSDMEDKGARYYSGTADYSREFTVSWNLISTDIEAMVFFEDVQEMAQVYINGNDCGIIWLPPYATRITPHLNAGTNTILVKVANTWNNRIVGDLNNPDKIPHTKTNAKVKFTKNSPLLQSGLMGNVEIRFVTK